MKCRRMRQGRSRPGRSPHGERGLKFALRTIALRISSRSPHGERGLKFILPSRSHSGGSGRSPHGERGLKWRRGVKCKPAYESLPARGAWIEMSDDGVTGYGTPGSLPARGAWIEIAFLPGCATFFVSLPARGAWIEIVPIDSILRKRGRSLPARGAWIEILTEKHELFRGAVAPRTGSVD